MVRRYGLVACRLAALAIASALMLAGASGAVAVADPGAESAGRNDGTRATTARIRAASAAKPGTTVRPPPAVAVGMAMVAAVGRATIRPATVAGNPAAGKAAGRNLPERNPAQGPERRSRRVG